MSAAAAAEPESPAAAVALLADIRGAIADVAAADLAALLARGDGAYDAFPEIELDYPRREWLAALADAAPTMPDETALPLLLFCAVLNPGPLAGIAALFERLAVAGADAELLVVAQLLARTRALGWEGIRSAVAVFDRRGADATMLALIGEILGQLHSGTEGAVGDIAAALSPRLLGDAAERLERKALAEAAIMARRRLAAIGAAPPRARTEVPAVAIRLAKLLAPLPRRDARPAVAWGVDRLSFAEFAGQWPAFEIEMPARRLHSSYAVLRGEALGADRHPESPFCRTPSLNLPGGRYQIRLDGETEAGAQFVVTVAGRPQGTVAQQDFVAAAGHSGPLAALDFANPGDIADCEIAVRLTSRSTQFALHRIAISVRRPEGI